MYYLVYKTTNMINGKSYVGCHKTKDLDDGYLGSGKLLKAAIKKYGMENFKREILFECESTEEMLCRERESICFGPLSYNLKEGGLGGFDYINSSGKNIYPKHKKVWEKKIQKLGRIALAKKLKNPDYKLAFSLNVSTSLKKHYETNPGHFSGKQHTELSKKKISLVTSIAQRGKGNSQYGTMWITDGVINKKIDKNSILPVGFRKGRI